MKGVSPKGIHIDSRPTAVCITFVATKKGIFCSWQLKCRGHQNHNEEVQGWLLLIVVSTANNLLH